jgi:hypothetical protein
MAMINEHGMSVLPSPKDKDLDEAIHIFVTLSMRARRFMREALFLDEEPELKSLVNNPLSWAARHEAYAEKAYGQVEWLANWSIRDHSFKGKQSFSDN